MAKRFFHLRGDSRLFPFAARTVLRRRQRRRARVLRVLGGAALVLAAILLLRENLFRGGQPPAPDRVAAASAAPDATPVPVNPRAATADALAGTEEADAAAHASPAPQATARPDRSQEILPAYRELYEQNPDMVGWLRVDGTKIDYPVVQIPGDNSYYLRRGFDRLYSATGTLFLDGRCTLGPMEEGGTANALIYGHNMLSGAMFGELSRYTDEAFFQEHPTFTFDTLTEPGTWKVAAVIRTELGADELPYYTFFDADGRKDWQQRVDAIMDLALYDTGVVPEYGDQLLTLSTCGEANSTTNKRLAVFAVKSDGA